MSWFTELFIEQAKPAIKFHNGIGAGSDISAAVELALERAKESGEFDGKDGVSPTISVDKNGKVTTISVNDVNGTKTATINDGETVSIVSVSIEEV